MKSVHVGDPMIFPLAPSMGLFVTVIHQHVKRFLHSHEIWLQHSYCPEDETWQFGNLMTFPPVPPAGKFKILTTNVSKTT